MFPNSPEQPKIDGSVSIEEILNEFKEVPDIFKEQAKIAADYIAKLDSHQGFDEPEIVVYRAVYPRPITRPIFSR